MWIYRNPNPHNQLVGDCVVRAISILLDKSWEYAYDEITEQGRLMYDMPSSNRVWGQYLIENGFERKILPDTCPICYSLHQFCFMHPKGEYLVATGSHVIAVIDGDYYDTWDSGYETVTYYFQRRNNSPWH